MTVRGLPRENPSRLLFPQWKIEKIERIVRNLSPVRDGDLETSPGTVLVEECLEGDRCERESDNPRSTHVSKRIVTVGSRHNSLR